MDKETYHLVRKFVYCVDGETKVTIRNKTTGEIREIDIEDLYLKDEYK